MKKATIIHVLGALVFATIPADAFAGFLQVYYTTDAGVKGAKPPGAGPTAWNAAPANGQINLTLTNGQSIWFAFLNDPDPTKFKFFAMEIGPSVNINTLTFGNDTNGFTTGDDTQPPVPKKALAGYGVVGGKWVIRYRFGKPQPQWERIGFKAEAAINNVVFTVNAWSECADVQPQWPKFVMIDGKMGAIQPGALIGNPRVTKIEMFPLNFPVNQSISPTFSAPGGTGSWTSSFVSVDPDGGSRPLGGVSFVSNGAGLSATDLFNLSYAAESGGNVDTEHHMYAFESVSQQWMALTVNDSVSSAAIPTVSQWGLIVMALLLLTAATIIFARRRVTALRTA